MTQTISRWVAASLAGLLFAGGASAQERPPRQFPANIHLPTRTHGDDAIAALGQRLPEVAAFYGKSPQEFRQWVREEHSLWADTHGRLFYVCDIQVPTETVAATNISPSDVAPFSTEQTFRLHSRKGSGKVVYLDFDGHDASGSSWGADAVGRPFDTDGNPFTFSSTERDRIVYVWQRVAEDFSMYDIDVTTEDPGSAALIKSSSSDTNFGIRVVIAGSSADWYGSAGGVAYVGSFDDSTDLPCWVFPKSLGPDNEKYIAEATSHEVGHTLGLSHDGRSTPSESYYQGQGNWAPIMGVGYYKPIVQWSKGEYANANQTQDDLAAMLSYGAVYRTDDHGNAIATATPLAGVAFSTNGVISQRTDLDFFSFTTGDGPVSITVNRAPRDSNLRLEVALYDTNGALLQTTNVADTSAGTQPVTLNAVLAAGTYCFSVDGIGSNSPLTNGYSDYASLGQFLVTGTLPSDSTWLPTAANTYDWTTSANWAANTLPNGVGATLRVNNNITGSQTISVPGPVTLGRLFLGDADASHGFTLQGSGPFTFLNLSSAATLSKTTGAADFINTPLSLPGDLIVTNSTAAPLTFAGPLNGGGALTKVGTGPLRIENVAAHTGGTIVTAGTLALGAAGSLAGAVEIESGAALDVSVLPGGWMLSPGQVLSGAGGVAGDVTVGNGAALAPGTIGTAGTLTLSNSLTLDDGAMLRVELASTDTPGGSTNDLVQVNGHLTLNGTITVNTAFLNTLPASPGYYTLVRYAGALTGSAANFTSVGASNRYTLTFDTMTPGEIRLLVSGMPADLVWKGDIATNRWNLADPTNWFDGAALVPFQQFDAVTFDNTGSASPAVNLTEALNPLAVMVNSASNYTFAGVGRISGSASLTKQGTGTLTLATANDFTGPVTVSAGGLKAANGAALGTTDAGTTIAGGAQLDLNAQNLGTEAITVTGAGPGDSGAIINSSGTAQLNALRFVTLAGPTTFGGTGRWDIRANPTATLTGNNFTLTKTGANEVWLVDLAGTSLGDISVLQGTLGIQDSTTLGNAASNLTLAAGATLSLWNTDVNALNKKLVMNGGTLNGAAGNNVFAGTATLNSNVTISVTAGLQMQGVIGGAGGFTKNGSGTLSLTAANTFTGAVTVAAGTLRTGNAAALGSTNSGTTIASDARLDVAGANLGAEMITVTGDGLGNAGAIINEGSSQQNALRFVTLAGNTTFGGISRWDIRANPTGFLVGSNRSLTKRGPSEVWLVNLGDTGLGAITVAEGTLGLQGTTTLGTAVSNMTVNSGCTLGIYATGTNTLSKAMTLSTAKIKNDSGSNTFAGTCSLSGSNTFDVAASASLNMAGTVSGSGSLWSITGGTLILSGNNTYSGVTVVKAGTLQIGNGGNTGTPGTAAITNNAMLVFNRTNDFTVANVIAGSGALTKLGSGVLTLSGANTFASNVTLNAMNSGILRLRHNTALGIGPKIINLKSGGSPNSAGTFGIELENNITLGADLAWNISNDGLANSPNIPALRSRSGTNNIAGNILIQSGGGGARIVSDPGSLLHLTGTITADVAGGRDLFLDGAGSGNFSGVISNGTAATMFVNMNKEGSGTWTFSGTNTSGGLTLIKAGTLVLSGTTGTNSLIVSNGATLRGTGVVRGPVTVNGTLAVGLNPSIGALAVSNALTLNGVTFMRIAKAPAPQADQAHGITALNYGGTLAVTNLGGALAEGDLFQLFNAETYNGSFASLNLPELAPGLTWSNRLALDGSLLVVRLPIEAPVISEIVLNLSGVNLDIQFMTQPGVNYILEQTGDLAPPIFWSPISTNLGDGNMMSLSPPADPLLPAQYFRVVAY